MNVQGMNIEIYSNNLTNVSPACQRFIVDRILNTWNRLKSNVHRLPRLYTRVMRRPRQLRMDVHKIRTPLYVSSTSTMYTSRCIYTLVCYAMVRVILHGVTFVSDLMENKRTTWIFLFVWRAKTSCFKVKK